MKKITFDRVTRRGVVSVLQGAITLFLSAWIGLLLFFPVEALEAYLEGEARGRAALSVEIEGLSVSFPCTLKAERLEIDLPVPLVLSSVRISPSVVSCLVGNPSLRISGLFLGGTIEAEARQAGDFSLKARGLNLAAAELPDLPLQLSGTVGELDLTGTFPIETTTETLLTGRLESLVATKLQSLGLTEESLPLGNLTVKWVGKGRTLRIAEFRTDEGVVDISGTGSILFAADIEQSRMKLRFDVKPLPQTPPSLLSVMDLFKEGKGSTLSLALEGSLETPSVKSVSATPSRSARR